MGKLPDDRSPKTDIADQCQGDGWKLLLLVAPDRLTASVQIARSAPATSCAPDKVVEMVRRSRLRLSSEEEARLPQLAQSLVSTGVAIVVAKGVPAESWKEVDWLIPIGLSSLRDYSDETVDLHEVSHFINVRAGQVLCELPAPPKEGCDVFGQAIGVAASPLQLGDKVGLDPRNLSRVVASQPGCVRVVDGRLSIVQELEIPGDLDFKTGNIDFSGDVIVRGSVLDGFHVKSAKNVVIDGGVGVATVEAAGSLTIKGGVNGGHKGRLVSGGDLQAHYLHMVSVECGGDVLVEVECHDSTVVAMGSVSVRRGGIIGGKVMAGTDVSAGFFGAEMCVPTEVHAGYEAALDAQMEKPRKGLARALDLVKNLESALARFLDQPGVTVRFPSQRKTQVIQLQTRLADARAVAKRCRAEMAAQMTRATPVKATIASAKQVFPKVTFVIDSVCEEEISAEIAGPVRFAADRDTLQLRRSASKPPRGR